MFAAVQILRYQPHGAMAPHAHDHASLNIIVAGGFQERIGKDDRVYARGHLIVRDGEHIARGAIRDRFRATMLQLLAK